MFDKLLDYVQETATQAERRKWQDREKEQDESRPKAFSLFHTDCKAGDLVEPCRKNAEHHRAREKHYTKALEKAEKELRAKGITLEVFDPVTNTMQQYGSIASGALLGSSLQPQRQQEFRPHVDQRLMDAVKNSKDKMMHHRGRAEKFEKEAWAFAFNPDFKVRLSIEDINYFRLEK